MIQNILLIGSNQSNIGVKPCVNSFELHAASILHLNVRIEKNKLIFNYSKPWSTLDTGSYN